MTLGEKNPIERGRQKEVPP